MLCKLDLHRQNVFSLCRDSSEVKALIVNLTSSHTENRQRALDSLQNQLRRSYLFEDIQGDEEDFFVALTSCFNKSNTEDKDILLHEQLLFCIYP